MDTAFNKTLSPIINIEHMTSSCVAEMLSNREKIVGFILPLGSLEQHGPHLPLGCDSVIALGASEHLAINFATKHQRYSAVVFPTLNFTPVPGAEYTSGTVSTTFDELGCMLHAILNAALRSPWAFVILVNAHAHNHGRVIEASVEFSRRKPPVPVVVLQLYEFAGLAADHGLEAGAHAGEFETALCAYYGGSNLIAKANLRYNPGKYPRPRNIYGLELMDRSDHGILAQRLPRINTALNVASALGVDFDKTIFRKTIENLDIFFEHWAISRKEKSRR